MQVRAAGAGGEAGVLVFNAGRAPGGRPDTESHPETETHRGGHRSASLLVRLDAPHGWKIGHEVSVLVDVQRIHLFDARGRRIDAMPVRANGASAAY